MLRRLINLRHARALSSKAQPQPQSTVPVHATSKSKKTKSKSKSKSNASGAEPENTHERMQRLIRLCKERGFIFPGSEIYGGFQGTFDYGHLGER